MMTTMDLIMVEYMSVWALSVLLLSVYGLCV